MLSPPQDLTRTTLAVVFIVGLLAATFWVLRPFLPAIVWAVTLVIATWPLMLRAQRYLGNRRSLAVLFTTVVLLLVVIVPMWLAIATVIENIDLIGETIRSALTLRLPPPPDWLVGTPVVGERATQAWAQLAALQVHDLTPKLAPYAGRLTQWFAAAVGGLGAMFLQFLLVVAIAAVMYARGEFAAAALIRFGRRLGGGRGETAVLLAGQAIRSVALGVVVTAIAQSLLGGIGLAVVGVPLAAVLTALMFILCLAQIGPGLVLIPAVGWMYYSGQSFWATVLLGFSLVAMVMDNFLRPVLIRRGAHLPLLLVLAGVIGGLIAYGLLGIFLGPTILAVAYTLVSAWMTEEGEESDLTSPAAPGENQSILKAGAKLSNAP
jgi:predicted PurR-regulated permease PerM